MEMRSLQQFQAINQICRVPVSFSRSLRDTLPVALQKRKLQRCQSLAAGGQTRFLWTSHRGMRPLATSSTSGENNAHQGRQESPLLRDMLDGILSRYWDRCTTASQVIQWLQLNNQGKPLYYDHYAFRTFGVPGLGIDSLASAFTRLGYTKKDELIFAAKKLQAYWYAPPNGDPSLPRLFISQIKVEELSPENQSNIHHYTGHAASHLGPLCPLTSVLGTLPWPKPSWEHFQTLAKESEYAAWTLVNGYALNHTTVSVHRLKGALSDISVLNNHLIEAGYRMNAEGALIKVSPDGGLLQSSTVADHLDVEFAEGEVHRVPGPYIEFAERLVLPEFKHLKKNELQECHRRDGFEVGNADKIFESTRLAAAS